MPFDRRLLLAGVAVGIATGFAAYSLDAALEAFQRLRERLGDAGPVLGPLFLVALPAAGGLIAGWLTRKRFPEAGGHGVAEVARAISEKDGKVSAHVAWVKTLASAATIGLGGSAGLEGPVVQIGSSVGSAMGRLFDSPSRDLKTFVAAGATGGLSAAFGIPLAGVFFTMEVILKDFANEAFPAVVVSSVTGAVVAQTLLGGASLTPPLTYQWTKASDLLLYAGLGVVCAALGRAYFAAIRGVEREFQKWRKLPEWTWGGVGGFLIGALTLGAPRVAGTGRATEAALLGGGTFGWKTLSLTFGKIAGTALTLGSGGSGGALTPSLFVGAAAGSGWGEAASRLHLTAASPGAYAIAGLCGVFTAAFSAPVTGMLIGVEMTKDYGLLMPVMICCAISYLGSRRAAGAAALRRDAPGTQTPAS